MRKFKDIQIFYAFHIVFLPKPITITFHDHEHVSYQALWNSRNGEMTGYSFEPWS
jgi:hypothetical protein